MQNTSTAPAHVVQARNRNAVNTTRFFWTRVFGLFQGRPFPHEQIQKYVEQHFERRPPRCASRQSVAVHESAHFLIAHVEEFAPAVAKIYGRRNDWAGEMRSRNEPCPTDPRVNPREL